MLDPLLQIVPIPAFRDNYIWCLRQNRHAVVVDPGDAQPVLDYLSSNELGLIAILTTHHHADHVGGVPALVSRFRVPVFGPAAETIPNRSHALRAGDVVEIPNFSPSFNVIEVPGHTAGHIAYYGGKLLFCGDTLFACGCGRLFEGTPQQMWQSLSTLASLPPDTQVYCAHEYTVSNIRFAKLVDPANTELRAREHAALQLRAAGRPTVPSSLALERATNPFLRTSDAVIKAAASRDAGKPLDDPASIFAALRAWKDRV